MKFKIGDKLVCTYVGNYSNIDVGDKATIIRGEHDYLYGETERGTPFGILYSNQDKHWKLERIDWRKEL